MPLSILQLAATNLAQMGHAHMWDCLVVKGGGRAPFISSHRPAALLTAPKSVSCISSWDGCALPHCCKGVQTVRLYM